MADRLEGVKPQLAPISSIMGQILMLGMWSKEGSTPPLEIRTQADWIVRQRLLAIDGVSQVFVMGGGRKQFQVLADPEALRRYDVTLHQVRQAVEQSNENATGGYLTRQGPNELLVRALGRIRNSEDIEKVVVRYRDGKSVTIADIARVVEAAQVKRGDSSAFRREGDGEFTGGPAVVLTVNKQPDADTRAVTEEILAAIDDLEKALPPDIVIEPELYSQRGFIDRAITNVAEALRDGGILVVIILILFLQNLRTTFITLTAFPLSLCVTALVFAGTGMSVNTMTLGGIVVAIGELMDDAIVDVENIFRRLKQNELADKPAHPLLVVYRASCEIRNSIVFGTIVVILGFVPLFALTGMEGRLFTPLAIAYVVSLLSSTLVSLTVTPVLSYWLLVKESILGGFVAGAGIGLVPLIGLWSLGWHPLLLGCFLLIYLPVLLALLFAYRKAKARAGTSRADQLPLLVRMLQQLAGRVIRFSIWARSPILIGGTIVILISILTLLNMERDFLPPFDEGTVQVNVVMPPGTSLQTSENVAKIVERSLKEIDDISAFVRRTGRAELDEHAMDVSISELIISFDPDTPRSRAQILDDIRARMDDIPGIATSVEQPLAHLISHMLSGVKAQVAIKLFGDDLEILRKRADVILTRIQNVPGVVDAMVDPQVIIPQIQIRSDRDQLKLYGLRPQEVNEFIETAMNGQALSTVIQGQRTFDLVLRLDDVYREDLEVLARLALETPSGEVIPLEAVADIYQSGGPNQVRREQVRRQIVVKCNVSGRGLVDTVEDIQAQLDPIDLPRGYFIEMGGQFENQQRAQNLILGLFVLSMIGIVLVLHIMFRSLAFSLQVIAAIPMAFIGSILALHLTGQTLSIAAMVGFISLGGIASRNGILLLNHYLHLVRHEGESWTPEMLARAGRERLTPVLMTAMTSGIGLIPLMLGADEPGKEILYPVATVHIGGLISCTLLDFLVRPALFWTFGRRGG